MSQDFKYTLLTGIFVAGLLSANLLGSKVTTIFGVSMSVGVFALPFTFLVTDAVAEVLGKKKAHQIVLTAIVAQILVLGLTLLSIAVVPADRFTLNEEYRLVFGNSARVMIASIIAFFVSQTHDIWAFQFWKEKTEGRMLWLRNNASTFVSQGIDTTLFMFIAFYGVNDRFTVGFIVNLIASYWAIKIIFAAIDTPFVYALVSWLRKGAPANTTA